MESVRKAKQRLKQYPIMLGKCSESAAIYAACVTRDLNVSHRLCEKEFVEFKKCLRNVAQQMKTKL